MTEQEKDAAHDELWREGKRPRNAEDQRIHMAEVEFLEKEHQIKSIRQSGMLEGFIYCFIIIGVLTVVIDVVRSIS